MFETKVIVMGKGSYAYGIDVADHDALTLNRNASIYGWSH